MYKDAAPTAATAYNNGFAARNAYLIQSHTVEGTFSFRIPLKHIFGFCEDYYRIVYGLKCRLTLVRKTDLDAIFRAAATHAGKGSQAKISWFVRYVIPAYAEKFSFTRLLNQKLSYQ